MKKVLTTTHLVLWIQENLHQYWDSVREDYNTDKCWHLTRSYAKMMQEPLHSDMFKEPMFEGMIYFKPIDLLERLQYHEHYSINGHCLWYRRKKWFGLFGKKGWYWSTTARTIEDLVRLIDLKPTRLFLDKLWLTS